MESVGVFALTDDSWDGTLEYFFFEPAGNLPAAVPIVTGVGKLALLAYRGARACFAPG